MAASAPVVSSRAQPTREDALRPPRGSAEQQEVVTYSAKNRPEPTREISLESRNHNGEVVSVHALGQYLYCKRSAILAAEIGDQSENDELPRLTYLPNFDLERIEEVLSKTLRWFGLALSISVCLIGLAVFAVVEQKRLLFVGSVFANMFSASWALMLMPQLVLLACRRRSAMRAESREPAPDVDGIQAVNWWSMLNTGFEPVRYDDRFVHPDLPLEGCPWRVLERGNQKIPVIRSGANEIGFSEGDLYPKHQIRLAAYALLLESMGESVVPYGLVFPMNSPQGLALPISNELKARTVATLEEFSQIIEQSHKQHVDPRPPENRNLCTECSFGNPEPITKREITARRKSGESLVVLQGNSGKTYHCACANRFGSVPPHRNTVKLGLTASVQ